MPELQHFNADRLAWDEVWAAFERDGAVVLEGFIDAALLARLIADVAPLVAAHQAGSVTEGFWSEFHGEQTKRVTGLAARSPAWCELLCDERYAAMADRYLGEGAYWLKHRPADRHRPPRNPPDAPQG